MDTIHKAPKHTNTISLTLSDLVTATNLKCNNAGNKKDKGTQNMFPTIDNTVSNSSPNTTASTIHNAIILARIIISTTFCLIPSFILFEVYRRIISIAGNSCNITVSSKPTM